MQRLSPVNAFRFISLFCFMGGGLSVIFLASHTGSRSRIVPGMQDLVSYFVTALALFVFFYFQYRLVPRFTKRSLSDRLGYWQALLGLGLLLIGLLNDLIFEKFWALPSIMLWLIGLVGEFMFVVNVVWSYTRGEVRARSSRAADIDFGWPKSPVRLFGIAAAFLGAMGLISIALGLPSFKEPMSLRGHQYSIPIGCLWLAAAVPFGLFTLLYKLLAHRYDVKTQESLTRLHFAVTIIAILGLSRLTEPGEQAMAADWLLALLGASTVIFAINTVRTFWWTAKRS